MVLNSLYLLFRERGLQRKTFGRARGLDSVAVGILCKLAWHTPLLLFVFTHDCFYLSLFVSASSATTVSGFGYLQVFKFVPNTMIKFSID